MTSTSEVTQNFVRHFNLLINGSNRKFLYLAIIYGIAASLLTIAVPISVQMLINTVANIASERAITILASILFGLLCIFGLLIACQSYSLELFERRFYASMVGNFSLRSIFADQQHYRSINGNDLTNRYFDIMRVQKIIPTLVAGLFATVLQMLVGIILVSFYHPWLFLFNALFVVCLYFICRIWGVRAMSTALDVSVSKYKTARHLEDIAQSNDFYKSSIRSTQAVKTSDMHAQHYIDARKQHFKNTFRQQIAFLMLYALSSALLLGLGGILVVREELTLGQLVAAELILMAVFFAISRFSYYLTKFYELTAALEEISRLFDLPLEKQNGTKLFEAVASPSLVFDQVRHQHNGQALELDIAFEHAPKVLIRASHTGIQRIIADLAKRYTSASKGRVIINGQDAQDYSPSSLRDRVIVIDKPTVVESTISDYLRIHAPEASLSDINQAIECVELSETIDMLPDGINTPILANGAPLKSTELLRLKLAGALLTRPQILVLNEYFDSISYHRRQRIFTRLCAIDDMILLYFSNRQDLGMFGQYLFIDWHRHQSFTSLHDLRSFDEISGETSE